MSQPRSTLPITLPEHVAGGSFNHSSDSGVEKSLFLMQALLFDHFPQWVKQSGRGIWGPEECHGSGKEAAPSATLASVWQQKHEIDPLNLCDTSAVTRRHLHRKVLPWPCSCCKYCMGRASFALNSGHFSGFSSPATKGNKIPFETLGAPDTANFLHLCCNIRCCCNRFRNIHVS